LGSRAMYRTSPREIRITASPIPDENAPTMIGHKLMAPKITAAKISARTRAPVFPSGRCQKDLDVLILAIEVFIRLQYKPCRVQKYINLRFNRHLPPLIQTINRRKIRISGQTPY